MREDVVKVPKRELQRYQVIGGCLKKEISQAKAGELLGLSGMSGVS
jgi:hypothetical protein